MSEEDVNQRVQDAVDMAKQAMRYAGDLEDRVDELETEVAELRKENERLRDQEQLFTDVRQNMQRTPEERAVVLIKSLNNEALTNQQLSQSPTVTMTIDAARSTLGGTLSQQSLHDAMEEAERLGQDDSVLWKVTGDPGRGGTDTELRLDLTNGDLPRYIAGEKIRQEPYRSGD